MKNQVKKRVPGRRAIVFLACVALVLTIAVGTTAAILIRTTPTLITSLMPSDVSCEVEYSSGGVSVLNDGNTDAYIRAVMTVTWKAGDEVFGRRQPVEGADYRLAIGDGWIIGDDGYYYYTHPVAADEVVTFISEITSLGEAPTDDYNNIYELSVDVAVSAIQSTPANAVSEYWNVTVSDDGTLRK